MSPNEANAKPALTQTSSLWWVIWLFFSVVMGSLLIQSWNTVPKYLSDYRLSPWYLVGFTLLYISTLFIRKWRTKTNWLNVLALYETEKPVDERELIIQLKASKIGYNLGLFVVFLGIMAFQLYPPLYPREGAIILLFIFSFTQAIRSFTAWKLGLR